MAQRAAASKAPKSIWTFDPTTISGCVLWLDGNDRNTTVTTVGGSTPVTDVGQIAEWKDKSIMQNHASNSDSASRPEYYNGLSFSNQFLQLADASKLPTGTSDATYFTVSEFQGTARRCIISYGTDTDSRSRTIYDGRVAGVSEIGAVITGGTTYNGVNPVDIVGIIDSNTKHTTTLSVNNLIGSVWVTGGPANTTNVDLQNTVAPVNTGSTVAYIGRNVPTRGFDYYNGVIYEILVYNSALSNTDRQIVEGYLAWKWGIEAQLPTGHPYKNIFRPMSRNFVPTDIEGCQLWLDPADSTTVTLNGSNKVTSIADKSGLGNNATNGSSSITYTSTLNGLPVLTFPDAASSLSTSGTITRNPVKRTYFFVIKYAVSVSISTTFISYGSNEYFEHNGGTGSEKRLSNVSTNVGNVTVSQVYTGNSGSTNNQFFGENTFILACVRDREKYTLSTNGLSVEVTGNSVGDESTGSSYIITASTRGHLVGDVIIYNSALTNSQRLQVEGYLMWKWGVRREASLKIPIPTTHAYYNFPPASVTPEQPELMLYKNEFDPFDLSPIIWIDPQDNSKITKNAANRVTEIKNKGRLNLPFINPTSIDGPLVTSNASRTGIGQQFLDFSNGGNYRVTGVTVESDLTTLTLTVSPPHNGAIPVGKFVNFTCITGTYPGGSSATLAIGPYQILSASISGTTLSAVTLVNHGITNNQSIYLTINAGTYSDGTSAIGLTGALTTSASGNSGTQLSIALPAGTYPIGRMAVSDGHVRNNVGTFGPYLTQAGTSGSTVKLTSYSNRGSAGSLANFTGHIEYGQIPLTSASVLISPLRLTLRTPINHGLSSGAGIGLCSNNNFCLPFQTSIPATNPLNAAAIQFTSATITLVPARITITVSTNPFFTGSVASPTYVGVNSIQLRLLTGTTYTTGGADATGLTVNTTTAAGSNSSTIVLSITSASPVAGNLTFTGGPGILYSGTGNSSFINGTVTTTSGTSGNTINCNITGTPPLANSGLLIKTTTPVFSSDDPVVTNSCILSPVKGFALENTSLGSTLSTNQMTIIWASCLTSGYYRNNFSNVNIQSPVISAAITTNGVGGADTTSFRIQTSSNAVGTSRMSIIRGGVGGSVSPALVPGGRTLTDTTSHFRINHAIMNLSGTAVDDISANTHAIATNGWGYASRFANSSFQATAGSQTSATLSPTHLRIGANTNVIDIIRTAANGAEGYALVNYPVVVSVDAAGDIYVAEWNNHRVSRVNVSTGVVTTVAGNMNPGYSGDGGLAINAQLNSPSGVCLDAAGNIYIADRDNHRIRKVTVSTGIITTVAGNGTAGYLSDGVLAANTRLNYPVGVSLDTNGDIYIADTYNHRVRKVTVSTGIITTVAGTGVEGSSGDAGLAVNARLNLPGGVSVDSARNIYISDTFNNRIRKVTVSTGIITAVAGTASPGYSGDAGPPPSAQLNNPTGATFDSDGNIYIADWTNHRIRKIDAPDYTTFPLNSHWYEGGLGDIMIFNSVLTFEQRKLVEGYMAEKYRCQEYLGGTSNVAGEFLHPYRTTSTRISPTIDLSKAYAQGLTVWFDAANSSTIGGSGTNVTSWTSAGGHLPLTLTAVGSSPQLVETAQNGLPGIRFTVTGGNGRPLRGPFTPKITDFTTASENNEYTIITVYRTANFVAGAVISCLLRGGGTNDRLVLAGNNFNYRGSQAEPPYAGTDQYKSHSATGTNIMYIGVHYRRGNVMLARVNGTVDTGATTPADLSIPPTISGLSTFGLTLGSYLGPTNGPFAGDIYEHIMFRYALTDQAIFQIEGYLAWKWGVNGSLPATHPYYEVMA
jgi:hypothetical protein